MMDVYLELNIERPDDGYLELNLRSEICPLWDFTQRSTVVYYRRFGTAYWFLVQCFLKMRPIGCPESVTNYDSSLRRILKERRSL
jgi:hypothetical protein